MKINEIMSRPVDLIDPTTTIAAAAGKMRDEDVGCLLVGRDDQLFGIVTDRDIAIRAVADGRNATREPVWTVMSNEVLCCFEDQPVEEAARMMAEHSVRRLPVFGPGGAVVRNRVVERRVLRSIQKETLAGDLLQGAHRQPRDSAQGTTHDGLRCRGGQRG